MSKSRFDKRLKAAMDELRTIVRDDLGLPNLVGLKSYIVSESAISSEVLENVFKGRPDGRVEEILDRAAEFCDALADKQEITEWEDCRSRVNRARQSADPKKSRRRRASSTKSGLDLWTPGISDQDIVSRFKGSVDRDAVEDLIGYSKSCLAAIADGDFVSQLQIAEDVIAIANDSNDDNLCGEANYLKAEALRLLADFDDDRNASKALRFQAIACYETAIDLLGPDGRPVRGKARTVEVLGDLDGALEQFNDAYAITTSAKPQKEVDRFSLVHEHVRSLRHRINCLSAIHRDTIVGSANHTKQKQELLTLLDESTQKHADVLQMFREFGKWWQIEWFMAEVLHARAYAAIGEPHEAARRLEWAIIQRNAMLESDGELTRVELGNLSWWSSAASSVRSGFTDAQNSELDGILASVGETASKTMIKRRIDRFAKLGQRPWETN